MIYYVYDSYYLAKSFGRATSLPARSAEMPRFPLSMPTAPSKLKTYLFHVDRQTKELRMSDDSSDSDSDDDPLLGAPTFNRGQSRREKVADRRKLDFLDEVVKTQVSVTFHTSTSCSSAGFFTSSGAPRRRGYILSTRK